MTLVWVEVSNNHSVTARVLMYFYVCEYFLLLCNSVVLFRYYVPASSFHDSFPEISRFILILSESFINMKPYPCILSWKAGAHKASLSSCSSTEQAGRDLCLTLNVAWSWMRSRVPVTLEMVKPNKKKLVKGETSLWHHCRGFDSCHAQFPPAEKF